MGDTCNACGRSVTVAGGIAGIWSLDPDRTGGLFLTLADDSEHFLCFDCVEELPDEPTAGDVEALRESGEGG